MDHIRALRKVTKAANGSEQNIRFITPIESAVFAAASVQNRKLVNSLKFAAESERYANTIGLVGQLNGRYKPPDRSGLQGRTYSALTRLRNSQDVNDCNRVIADLIHSQYSTFPARTRGTICHVVGELHDNVASHASGCGFSAAQVMNGKFHFAVADCGIGMPRLVREHKNRHVSDEAAVRWCLGQGHTTAATPEDPFAQRVPEDFNSATSPFPPTVKTLSSDNNHMGEGLWQLRELVRNMQGEMRISSEKANLLARDNSITPLSGDYYWQGVAISFTLTVQDVSEIGTERRLALDELSEQLGIFE